MSAAERSALKEWAAIEQVLGSGESVLLLRKGGIWEKKQGFEVEHRRFWLFPTYFHQNPTELVPSFAWALERARAAQTGPDEVRLEHVAVVEDAFRLESLETALALEGLHTLTPETVRSRFEYRNRPYLHALVLRLHRLPAPHVVPNTLDYEGCVSWVALDDELPADGARPVLDDAAFAAKRAEILGRLEGAAGVSRT